MTVSEIDLVDWLCSVATCLFHCYIDEVFVFKPKFLCTVFWANAFSINHETHLRRLQTKSAAVSIHQFPQRRGLFDFELHFTALLVLPLQLNVRWCRCPM